jgi:hypothetical protein
MGDVYDDLHQSRFTVEEDVQLRELVAEHGTTNWAAIAEQMQGRNARQCRERWKHYLSCNKRRVPWTRAEDDLLLEKVTELGPKWTKIAAVLGDRSDLEVKNRWIKKVGSELIRTPRIQRRCRLVLPDDNESGIFAPRPAPVPAAEQETAKNGDEAAFAIVLAVDPPTSAWESAMSGEWTFDWDYLW